MKIKLCIRFWLGSVVLLSSSSCVHSEDSLTEENSENVKRVEKNFNPIIEIVNGAIQGTTMISRDGNQYHAFLGIPYAKQPSRFQVAEPVENWEGVRSAKEYGSRCPQADFVLPEEFLGHEDCLFANIHKPKDITENDSIPVMIYIHGGAFTGGSGEEYGAKYFMDEKIILVTFNYRLGALGFLSTEDMTAPGNMGLKDQILLLKFIQQNIKSFGGDPSRITIFGGSAGAACVSLLLVSPMAKGLFHYAISQSGTSLSPWAIAQHPAKNAKRLAEILKCPQDDTEELIKCLNTKDVKDIVMSQQKFTKWHTNPNTPFAPTIEYFVPYNALSSESKVFLPESPEHLLEKGDFNKVSWIIGINEGEGLLLHAENDKLLTDDINNEWKRVAPITLLYDDDESLPVDEKDDFSTKIREFYFGDSEISKGTRKNLTNLYTDRYFLHGVRKAALLHAKQSPVYPYIFTFQGDFSFLSFFGVHDIKGVTHGDDTQYFFNTKETPEFEPESESHKFSKKIVKLWSSFAENGVPSATWEPETVWRSFEISETKGSYPLKWYKLDYNTELLEEYFTDRLEFWNNLFHVKDSIKSATQSRDEF